MKDIKVGDISLFRKQNNRDDGIVLDFLEFLQKDFDGEAIHAAIIMSVGNFDTVQVDIRGVQLNYPLDVTNEDLCIVRIKDIEINPISLINTIQIWYAKMPKDKKTGIPDYDVLGVTRAGFWKFLSFISMGIIKRTPIIPDNNIPFCSESVAEIIYLNSMFRFRDKDGSVIPDSVLTPSDILNSTQVEIIKDFGSK